MTDQPAPILVVRRLLPVPRERVFAAWLDSASLVQWMHAGADSSATVEADPRVGGKFRIVMRHSGGEVEHRGEYLVIEPPSLLSFTWISANTDLRPTVVSIEFLDRNGKTELVLSHRQLPAAQVENHRKGWTEIVAQLEETLVKPYFSPPSGP